MQCNVQRRGSVSLFRRQVYINSGKPCRKRSATITRAASVAQRNLRVEYASFGGVPPRFGKMQSLPRNTTLFSATQAFARTPEKFAALPKHDSLSTVLDGYATGLSEKVSNRPINPLGVSTLLSGLVLTRGISGRM